MTSTQTPQQAVLESVPTGLFIGGRWRPSDSGNTFAVHDPATGRELAVVADATIADGAAALDAAATAQRDWARTAPRERAELLRAAFDAVIARSDDFALLMTLEMGKPLAEALGEVTYGAEFLRWFSEEAVRVSGRYAAAPDGKTRLLVHKRPVGPCLFITPWNFPLAMATRKIAPAIAAGCTMVVKPATLTPLTTLLLAQVFEEVGLPTGVLNVIPTSRAGAVTGPLITDPRLRKLSFTGSTEVGRRLLADSAQQVLRTSMELGGNAPFLVFADADIDAAVDGAMVAKLRNMGEACTAANRFLVHEAVAEEFATKLADKMARLVVGPGIEADSQLGPLIDEESRAKVHDLVQDAVAHGAAIVTGGRPVPGDGYFYSPTVLTGVTTDARILREEVFGPVAPITTFRDEEHAVQVANDTEYGLVAYVYTRDTARTLRMSEELETGMLGINVGVVSNPAAPFGGVKQSGLGREGGFEGIDEYLDIRYVGLADPYA
ncbi:NAD-dependent succinate-semialdehyde dehydrogenase [Rhodococcus sp. LB1]|uniref:NAD-dependent succinate-semialdehyde dehydrogenase n=1 Tax=Rhodococcus sp. LB1 TaxID=1807499 RepID=UPI00077B0545|nr:NAD-dependent succinate-semialdehyde dehydrogenase [Rhodococcus sp. LB1]KXX56699.1 NAD-dependent succinate-semialdehyde dehydrogenase [Rhodococcus sp. LB1]